MSQMSPALSSEADEVAKDIKIAMTAVRQGEPTDLDALRKRSDALCDAAMTEANESDDTVRALIVAKLESIVSRMNVLEGLLRDRQEQERTK